MTKELEQMIEDLEEASELEGTECGEWWDALIRLRHRIADGASREFLVAWEAEIKKEHAFLKEKFEIVEEEVTQTSKYRELRWKG